MTLNNRAATHRLIKARQGLLGGNDSGNSTPNTPGSLSNGGGNQQPGGGKTSPTDSSQPTPGKTKDDGNSNGSPSTSTTTPDPPRTTDTSTESATKPSHSEKADKPSVTPSTDSSSSSDSTSSTTTSTSTTSSLTTTSVTTPSSTLVVATRTGTPVTQTLLNVSSTPTFSDTTTASASSTNVAATGGLSTGAIIGSVGGGIVGLAILATIIAFVLRRWRRRRAFDPDFNPDEFISSPPAEYRDGLSGPTNRVSTFDPSPPNMAQLRGHGPTPSMSGGSGMAGHGAYPYAAGIQSNYAYGNQYDPGARDDEGSDLAHGGPYSSQPQQQAAYNAEAYASYVHAPVAHQRGMQQGYHPYQHEAQQAFAYSHDATPALVPGAHSVAANRSTRSINNDDAYGGI